MRSLRISSFRPGGRGVPLERATARDRPAAVTQLHDDCMFPSIERRSATALFKKEKRDARYRENNPSGRRKRDARFEELALFVETN